AGSQFFPSKGAPEGEPAKNGEGHVKEQENEGIPEHIAAKEKLRFSEQILFELLLGKSLMRSVVQRQGGLHNDEARERKKDEDDEMGPGPGNAQILWENAARLEGFDRRGGGMSDGIAGELNGTRFIGRRLGHGWQGRILLRGIGRIVVE